MKKKIKRYADGGLAGIADAASSLMGDVNSMASRINYGNAGSAGAGPSQSLGFLSLEDKQASQGNSGQPMTNASSPAPAFKRGGKVKAGGYRKVADGIATKGKTKGRMV